MSLPNQPFFISIHIWHLFFFYLTMEIIHNQHLWPKAHSTPMWDTAQSQSTTISSSICQWSAGSFQSLVRHHVYKLGMHTPALLLCLGRLRCEPRCWALCHSPQSALGACRQVALSHAAALIVTGPVCMEDHCTASGWNAHFPSGNCLEMSCVFFYDYDYMLLHLKTVVTKCLVVMCHKLFW